MISDGQLRRILSEVQLVDWREHVGLRGKRVRGIGTKADHEPGVGSDPDPYLRFFGDRRNAPTKMAVATSTMAAPEATFT